MREQIILAPGVSSTELLGTLAKLGTNTIGTRVMNAEGLAELSLMRSGIPVCEEYLTRQDAALVVSSFIRDIGYFETVSFADAESMSDALFSIRQWAVGRQWTAGSQTPPGQEAETIHDLLSDGEFKEKNAALIKAYDLYMEALTEAGKIDAIGKIRRALEKAEPIDADFFTLREYPLTALEQALLDHLSSGTAAQTTISELAHLTPKQPDSIVITDCYGASNEVRDLLHYIYQNGIPLDQCTIAVTDAAQYGQLLYEICAENGIPVRFGCGIPIHVTNPARLLLLYHNWRTRGYCGVDALRDMLQSSAFDRNALREKLLQDPGSGRIKWDALAKTAGYLRLSDDSASNESRLKAYAEYLAQETYRDDTYREEAAFYAECAARLAKELEQGAAYWIETYSNIRQSDRMAADLAAQRTICDRIEGYLEGDPDRPLDGIVQSIFERSAFIERSAAGCLFVTDIRGAMSGLRKHLFVAGLSANHFPGTPTENYLMLDSDYLLLGAPDAVPTSSRLVERKKADLDHLLSLAASAGTEIRLSYPSFDLATLKELNPSSVLFDIFKSLHGSQSKYEDFINANAKAGFFDDGTSRHAALGRAYAAGSVIKVSADPDGSGAAESSATVKRAFSASAVEDFVSCPKKFYFKRVLSIPEPEEDDPASVISAAEVGNMLHDLMTLNGQQHMTEEAFLTAADQAFARFLKCRPPLSEDLADKEKDVFLDMAENAFRQEPEEFEAVLAETYVEADHPSGVTIYGYPDRVERRPDGSCRIVDFKTGRTDKQDTGETDYSTYLQTLLYAYILETMDVAITQCEYRYPRLDVIETCDYDDAAKQEVQRIMEKLKGALDAGDFPAEPGDEEDDCKYCRYWEICGRY